MHHTSSRRSLPLDAFDVAFLATCSQVWPRSCWRTSWWLKPTLGRGRSRISLRILKWCNGLRCCCWWWWWWVVILKLPFLSKDQGLRVSKGVKSSYLESPNCENAKLEQPLFIPFCSWCLCPFFLKEVTSPPFRGFAMLRHASPCFAAPLGLQRGVVQQTLHGCREVFSQSTVADRDFAAEYCTLQATDGQRANGCCVEKGVTWFANFKETCRKTLFFGFGFVQGHLSSTLDCFWSWVGYCETRGAKSAGSGVPRGPVAGDIALRIPWSRSCVSEAAMWRLGPANFEDLN